MSNPPQSALNQDLEQAAHAILHAVRTGESERALTRVRFLLAKYGNDTVAKMARLMQAEAYLECERIALRAGRTDLAKEIRRVGKLDELSVTECKSENIRG